jgi:UMF1 family MFS transporter
MQVQTEAGDRRSAWYAYDVASSSYALMVASVAFPVYFVSVVLENAPGGQIAWALLLAASLIAAGLLSPLVGALVDLGGRRRRLMALFTAISCAATAAMTLLRPGDVWAAVILFLLSQAGFLIATSLYDSTVSKIAGGRLALTSGIGWGIGYLGGIGVLLLCLPLIAGPLDAAHASMFAYVFVVTAAFYFVIGTVAIAFGIRDSRAVDGEAGARAAGRRVTETISRWRERRAIFRFLAAYYLIIDGTVSLATLAPIYVKLAFGLSAAELLMLTIVFNVVAIPATIVFGWWAERIGERRALYVTLGILAATVVVCVTVRAPWAVYAIPVLLALGVGSTQALCRSLYARLVGDDRTAELFGFSALAGRLSAALGPLLFALVAWLSGSERIALLSLVPFFIAGAWMLSQVPLAQSGRSAALPRHQQSEQAMREV